MALTKAEMAEKLFDELGLNKREAKEMVEMFLKKLEVLWKMALRLNCLDLAILICVRKNNVRGRNPKTGEEIPISARRVVTFRPGQKLKARVEAYAGRE